MMPLNSVVEASPILVLGRSEARSKVMPPMCRPGEAVVLNSRHDPVADHTDKDHTRNGFLIRLHEEHHSSLAWLRTESSGRQRHVPQQHLIVL
jgi:hypothetical protein